MLRGPVATPLPRYSQPREQRVNIAMVNHWGRGAGMANHWIEIAGYLAALASFYAFCTKTMMPLRIAAVVGNVLFALYWFMKGYPS